MAKQDFANFCDFAKFKALLCHSALSWTALSEFFRFSEPYNFIKKTFALRIKCVPMKDCAFRLLRVKDKSH